MIELDIALTARYWLEPRHAVAPAARRQ